MKKNLSISAKFKINYNRYLNKQKNMTIMALY